MQSGKAKTKDWVLEYEPQSAKLPDPLMGWQQSSDMDGQIRLSFDTLDEAVAYARGRSIPFQVLEPKPVTRVIKAYADNFAFNRKQPWTH
jgi:hypothetical protein